MEPYILNSHSNQRPVFSNNTMHIALVEIFYSICTYFLGVFNSVLKAVRCHLIHICSDGKLDVGIDWRRLGSIIGEPACCTRIGN